jgi:trigger factor
MQVSVENTGGLERRLTVQVPGSEIQDKINAKLRELSKQVRIKGFRPGRVPMSVVKQRYGKQVRQDIVNETMQASLQQAIQDEALRPAAMPKIDSEPETIDGGDLAFSALIEVFPEIEQLDISALEIERPETEVSEEDVEDMLNTLREQRKTWNPVERTAAAGDQVLIDYVAESDDLRVPAEGEERLAIIVGESGFEKLENAVAKIPAGENKKVSLTFPEDFRERSLAGKKAKVDVKVVSVSEPVLPEVDEAFIRDFGIEDGELDTLKVEIRGNLERELKQALNSVLKARLVEKLIEVVPDMEVPDSVVRQEAFAMASQLVQAQGQQMDPAQLNPVIEQLSEQFTEQAEGRVRSGLLLGEVAQQNSIRVDGTKVREAIETIANTYEEPAEVVQLYYQNQRLMQQVESSVLEEQVVDWVLENAKVKPREMKFQDVITSATQAAQGL